MSLRRCFGVRQLIGCSLLSRSRNKTRNATGVTRHISSVCKTWPPLTRCTDKKYSQSATMSSKRDQPKSCDTFVVLPPATANGCIIFGKNSDRMDDEVQEVVYIPAEDHQPETNLQCTYLEIPQVAHTHAVILSKPSWMWGAEMGANEHGVCIGNEAVFTKLNGPGDVEEKLLGMDMLRLALLRGATAKEALDVITSLLEQYGQGGPCHADASISDGPHKLHHSSFLICDQSEALALERAHTAELAVQVLGGLISMYGQGGNCAEKSFDFTYHNSFLVADQKEAYILETAGNHWALERIKSGFRNISNQLTIRTKIDKMSHNLKDVAQENGWWTPDQDFDFAKVFSSNFEETELKANTRPCTRQLWGTQLLQQLSEGGNFKVLDMMNILRHHESGICMTGGFVSAGSQVSVLPPKDSGAPCVHFFTATPDPSKSLYKPFVFTENASLGDKTISPTFGDKDPAKVIPRFQSEVDRRHPLWRAHESFLILCEKKDPKGEMLSSQIREMEEHAVNDVEDVIKQGNFDKNSVDKLSLMFKHMVDLEMNFYKMS